MSLGPASFLDPVALAIVGGGTAATAILRHPLADLGRACAALRVLARRASFDGDATLAQIAALGRIARGHGVIALDRARIADPDVAGAVAAIVEGAGPAAIAGELDHLRRARAERHAAAAEVWATAADTAPAMGMIGTLIGLVRMFTAMTDPSAIGGAMAIALLTTLYGAVLANLVLAPVAARLRRLGRAESFERARIVAPLTALAERERPRRELAAA